MQTPVFESLDRSQYAAAAPLFSGLEYHLAVPAIFAGEAPARLYAKDPAHPGAALAWLGHRFYLAGDPGAVAPAALASLFADQIVPEALAAGRRFAIFYYEPEDWGAAVATALAAFNPAQAQREYWEFHLAGEAIPVWRGLLPEGFTVRPVDAALLQDEGLQKDEGLQNLDRLVEETCSERPTVEDFLARSFGACLVREGRELAGWCLSEYNTGDRCEVGIEIVEPYQRRGLGALVTGALLEEARARGLSRVGWHCWAGNAASSATAHRAGFTLARTYPSQWARLDVETPTP